MCLLSDDAARDERTGRAAGARPGALLLA